MSRGGQGGSRGYTWKFPKLGPTHRWLSVWGGGVYVHYVHMYIHTYVHFWHKIKFQVDLPMGPWPKYGSDFFLKLAYPTVFSPQILSNTITPCAQLKYLRKIWPHSIKKLHWNPGPLGPGPTLPSNFFLKLANPTAFSLGRHLNTTTMSSYLKYLMKIYCHCFKKWIWNP